MRFSSKGLTAAALIIAMLVTQAFIAFAGTSKSGKKRQLTEEQRIIHVLNRIVAGDISPATRETLLKQIDEKNAKDSVATTVGLILGTPEFQRQ